MDDSFYRDIAETSVDGLWVIDLLGNTRYANPALAAMFGVSVAEFCELTVFDTLDEQGRAEFELHLQDLRAGRENPETVEVLFHRQDGTSTWTLLSEQLLRDEEGRPTSAIHRITRHDKLRAHIDELSESRRQLDEAQKIARLGGWTLEVATGEIQVSDHLRELYRIEQGHDPISLTTWVDNVHPDDQPEVRRQLAAAIQDGCDFDFVSRVAHGSGDADAPQAWTWTRGKGVAHRGPDGTVTSLSAISQDIDGHKRTEEALEHELGRNALLQAVTSAANEARTLEEAVSELRLVIREREDWDDVRAYRPSEDGLDIEPLAAEDMLDAIDPDEWVADHDLARETLYSAAPRWDETGTKLSFPITFKGQVRAVVVLVASRPTEDPATVATAAGEAAVQLVQVIEREHAEQQLSAARDAALRASQAKSEFLAVMSHEIRTPLNGVIGLNELLLKTELGSRQQQLATGVRDAGRSLLRLINDVLDLSKIEAGRLELEKVDFDVREVCDQAVGLLGDAARRKHVELAVACHPDVPEILAGDPTRFGQVLANLVSNAVKFTDEGSVLVSVSSQRVGRRVRLRVEVSDTGMGITPEAQQRIFDDFSQADVSTTRVHGGTGLGLSISRRIAVAMDGELTVSSSADPEDHGSTFSFSAVLEAPRGARTSPDDDLARARLTGGHILVVSDDHRRGELLCDQMALWRPRIHLVADTDEALAAIASARADEDPFEAVVVDVPAKNPHEAREIARLIPQSDGMRVFLVLTQRPESVKVTERELEVQVLTKPVTSAALREALMGAEDHVLRAVATTTAQVRTDRRRVLVVEDNPVNQMVASGMLESLGYDVDIAEDGEEGVARFDPARHDAVLMDIQMPRMDGYVATRRMRELHVGPGSTGPRTPILAMTAAAVEGERQRCLDAGMDDFLTKPVDLNLLGNSLARWIPAERPLADVTSLDPSSERGALEGADEDLPSVVSGPLDLARLEMLFEMDPGPASYLMTAIGNFLTSYEATVASVREAVGASDAAAVRTAAHRLVGSALNLGLVRVGEAAREVELWDVNAPGCSFAAYDALVDDLEDALAEGVPALSSYGASRGRLATA